MVHRARFSGFCVSLTSTDGNIAKLILGTKLLYFYLLHDLTLQIVSSFYKVLSFWNSHYGDSKTQILSIALGSHSVLSRLG